MKCVIAILALLGVASASYYGMYPEKHDFLGPYTSQHYYHQEPIHYPWYHKYGQTFPWTSHKTFPYGKYHTGYPTYGRDFVPEYVHEKYPIHKELSLPKHFTESMQYHNYPYTHEKFVPFYEKYMPKYEGFVPEYPEHVFPKYDKFVPFYSKYMTKNYPQYEKFMPKYYPQYEKFMPKYEKFVPEYEKIVSEHEKFVPSYEKFVPSYEKFVPSYEKFVPSHEKFVPSYEKFVPSYEKFVPSYEKFVPSYEKFVPEYLHEHGKYVPHFVQPHIVETEFKPTEKIVTKTLETDKVVETPKIVAEKVTKSVGEEHIHEKEFAYPKFEKFSPYYGYKPLHTPYIYGSEHYPKYFESRPYHY